MSMNESAEDAEVMEREKNAVSAAEAALEAAGDAAANGRAKVMRTRARVARARFGMINLLESLKPAAAAAKAAAAEEEDDEDNEDDDGLPLFDENGDDNEDVDDDDDEEKEEEDFYVGEDADEKVGLSTYSHHVYISLTLPLYPSTSSRKHLFSSSVQGVLSRTRTCMM